MFKKNVVDLLNIDCIIFELASSIISRNKECFGWDKAFRLYHFHFLVGSRGNNEQQDFSLKIIIFLVFSNERKLKRLGNYSIHRERFCRQQQRVVV